MMTAHLFTLLYVWLPSDIGLIANDPTPIQASGHELVLASFTAPQQQPKPERGAASLEGEVFEPEPAKSITIDLKTQTLTAMENGVPVLTFHCSTGRNNGTPAGDWPVRQKLRWNVALPEYNSVPIPYSLRLGIVYKGVRYRIAIHAHNSVPRYPASHGCIRLRYPDARKLFDWAEVGIMVNIR
ncbi:MAG: L,D-transpeptidase [Fimbriimonadales bacterium]